MLSSNSIQATWDKRTNIPHHPKFVSGFGYWWLNLQLPVTWTWYGWGTNPQVDQSHMSEGVSRRWVLGHHIPSEFESDGTRYHISMNHESYISRNLKGYSLRMFSYNDCRIHWYRSDKPGISSLMGRGHFQFAKGTHIEKYWILGGHFWGGTKAKTRATEDTDPIARPRAQNPQDQGMCSTKCLLDQKCLYKTGIKMRNNFLIGDFRDAWWQQTYQVNSIVLGCVRVLRTT